MKVSKTIFITVFLALVTRFAVAQNFDGSFNSTEKTDPFKIVQVFPNPAVEYLVVRFTEPRAQTAKLTIHSIIGNAVEVERENVDQHEIRLRVKDLAPGYYFLAVKDDETSTRNSFKFLKR